MSIGNQVFAILILVGASFAYGDTATPPQTPQAPPSGMTSPGPSKLNPNVIQTMDGNFFDAKKEEKPAVNANGRHVGDEPDYTSDQREKWLKICAKYKEKDGEAYRKCYQEEKEKFQKGLKEAADLVERRLNEPLRNTNPLMEDQRKNMQGGGEDN